jgi:hypothetical protein
VTPKRGSPTSLKRVIEALARLLVRRPRKKDRPVGRPIREQLTEPFPEGASFHLHQGIPYLVVADWDHAERWDTDPPAPAHPFAAVLAGRRLSEAEFRALVERLHVGGDGRPTHVPD